MRPRRTDQLTALIQNSLPNVLAVYYFGSYGTAFERKDSDVDLAVLSGIPIENYFRWEVEQNIANFLGRDVDLVDLEKASTVFRFQVITGGERVFCSDVETCERYENYFFSSFARLNEERRGILTDIIKRGNVYDR